MKRFLLVACFLGSVQVQASSKPNIVFILADDLVRIFACNFLVRVVTAKFQGWNDVGFHGSNLMPTPNIDALAYSGVILNEYYVTPLCMWDRVLNATQPYGLGLEEKLLPHYMKDHGYAAHMFGHQAEDWLGRDLYDNKEATTDITGEYLTRLYTRKAVEIVEKHDTSQPLLLYLAHTAVHINNVYEWLQAPAETIDKMKPNLIGNRRIYAGSPSFGLFDNEWSGSDESVGAEYDLASVQSSPVAAAFAKTSHRLPSKDEILRLRKEATKDYCENVDVAAENPEVVARLLEALARHSETVVPNRAKPADPRANPALYGGFYVPWMDGIEV
ncbi:hypothetical protein B566_EDAN005840 [Ephemera danica]|nr:hypothetical protein B566_EDAN005840 [Ephemera danica]